MIDKLCLAICLTLGATAAEAATLPADIAAKGSIVAAIVPNYPPLDLRDPATNKLSGLDVDLGEALAKELGVKITWQETSFQEMIPALRTKRVDIIISGMTDLANRHDSASFVDYLKSGPQFFTQASKIKEFPDMLALCGKSVGTSRRTSFPHDIATWSDAHCTPAGKPAVKVVGTEGSADARTQLKQGRIDAALQGNETLPYIMAQEPNTFAPIGEPIAYQYTGIGVAKDDTALQQALADALNKLIASGAYQKLLDKWSLSSNGVQKATINAGQ